MVKGVVIVFGFHGLGLYGVKILCSLFGLGLFTGALLASSAGLFGEYDTEIRDFHA